MKPPLPNPKAVMNTHGRSLICYTEAQILAYRAEVIEMCAAKCESQDATGSVNQEWMQERCANAIRGLK